MGRAGRQQARAKAFFIEQKQKHEQDVAEHAKQLAQALHDEIYSKYRPASNECKYKVVLRFEFSKYFLQHLKSRGEQLYSLLYKVKELDEYSSKLHKEISADLQTQIKKASKGAGVENDAIENQILVDMLTGIGTDKWTDFTFGKAKNRLEGYCVLRGEYEYNGANYFFLDESKAEKLADTLNTIAKDAVRIEKIEEYHTTNSDFWDKNRTFDSQLDDLVNRYLLGAIIDTAKEKCESCPSSPR